MNPPVCVGALDAKLPGTFRIDHRYSTFERFCCLFFAEREDESFFRRKVYAIIFAFEPKRRRTG